MFTSSPVQIGAFSHFRIARVGRSKLSLVAWGFDGECQIDVPTNSLRFVSITVGADHNLAIAEDGSVVAWGRNDFAQTV